MSNKYVATKNGLFKDGKPVPLEFGNEEQIKAIRKYEKNSGVLETEQGLHIEPDYICKAEGTFTCTCGRNVYYEIDCDSEGDVDPFVGETVNCHGCGNEYEFSVNDADEIFVSRNYNPEK